MNMFLKEKSMNRMLNPKFFSDRQDSRSHSSRRSSPESERQGRSRAGSHDSRERDRERDQFDRDRKEYRQPQNQPITQQRDWEPEPREWGVRGREPLLLRPNREPIRERDLREMRERERLLPEGLISLERLDRDRGDRERERDRDRGERERMLPFDLLPLGEPKSRAEMRLERGEYEPLLPREALADMDKPSATDEPHVQIEPCETEKIDSLDGECFLN